MEPRQPSPKPTGQATGQRHDVMFCTVGDLLTMLNEAVRLHLNVPTMPTERPGKPA